MNIIRKLKLTKLSGIDYLSDTEREIVDFFNSKFLDLSEFRMDEYPDTIFYMNSNDKYVFEYNSQIGYLYVDYKIFQTILNTKYNLEYSDLPNIIKYMFESIYKLKVKKTPH